MLDHLHGIPIDTAGAIVGGIRFPVFEIPGVPLRLDPGAATTQLGFNLNGDTIRARFAIRSSNVRWSRDSALGNSTIGDLIWRAVSGIANLDVEARLSGELHHPTLAVRSNLDQAIAARLRAVLGEKSEEHTSELQSQSNLVCRLLHEKKKRSNPRRPEEPTPELQTQSNSVYRLPHHKNDTPSGLQQHAHTHLYTS